MAMSFVGPGRLSSGPVASEWERVSGVLTRAARGTFSGSAVAPGLTPFADTETCAARRATRGRNGACLQIKADDARTILGSSYPKFQELVPRNALTGGSYVTRFAESLADLKAIQRLRFEVFNVELHEGLDASYVTGLDQDQFDLACHHLMVSEASSGQVVGTR